MPRRRNTRAYRRQRNGGVDPKVGIPPMDDITRADYPAIFDDTDGDEILDGDDAEPRRPSAQQIEELRLSAELGALIDERGKFVGAKRQVEKRLRGLGITDAQVYGRVKSPVSLINKLRRKALGTLTDVAGTMIVVPTAADARKAVRELDDSFVVSERRDYYRRPLNGYRAFHLIIDLDGVPVEIQVKTERMKTLSAVSHHAYKTGRLDPAGMDSASMLATRADEGDRDAQREWARLVKSGRLVSMVEQ